MAKTDFKTIDEYLASLPEASQKALQTVRQAIKKAVPEAEEVISYQVPAFKYHGWLFYMSGYKNHYSLACPPPCDVFDAFKKELSGHKRSISTVQFPLDQPVPQQLIYDMAAYQAKRNAKAKTT